MDEVVADRQVKEVATSSQVSAVKGRKDGTQSVKEAGSPQSLDKTFVADWAKELVKDAMSALVSDWSQAERKKLKIAI